MIKTTLLILGLSLFFHSSNEKQNVTGTLVDLSTDRPLSLVEFQVWGENSAFGSIQQLQTDAHGHFTLQLAAEVTSVILIQEGWAALHLNNLADNEHHTLGTVYTTRYNNEYTVRRTTKTVCESGTTSFTGPALEKIIPELVAKDIEYQIDTVNLVSVSKTSRSDTCWFQYKNLQLRY